MSRLSNKKVKEVRAKLCRALNPHISEYECPERGLLKQSNCISIGLSIVVISAVVLLVRLPSTGELRLEGILSFMQNVLSG